MSEILRITSIRFRNYKAFKDYSISLGHFNVLVGPNNAGKSTVLGALRILSEGVRRARSKNPVLIDDQKGLQVRAHPVTLEGLPVSTENVFHNYDESNPATIDFRLSNGSSLNLYFPERGQCYLLPVGDAPARSTSEFKRHFDIDIAFVPTLGPVEHNERFYQKEAARSALLTHGASRNFRNIWYHYTDGFAEFRKTIQETWPGMDIQPPEVIQGRDKAITADLQAFCWHAIVHDRKELENFILHPSAIERAIKRRLSETQRKGRVPEFDENVAELLMRLAEGQKNRVQAQLSESYTCRKSSCYYRR